jgi:Glycine cleavage H-protein
MASSVLRTLSRCRLTAITTTSTRYLSTLYAPTHEYVKISGNIGTIGITDHAAGALGDIVYIELPQVGKSFKAGDTFGSVVSTHLHPLISCMYCTLT